MTRRETFIANLIQKLGKASSSEIFMESKKYFDKVSKITIIRDLGALVEKGHIKRYGKGRNVWYEVKVNPLLKDFDLEEYFANDTDKREIQRQPIVFKITKNWVKLLNDQEAAKIENLTQLYHQQLKKYTKKELQKELERITIEFSWKSSQIEGNTYNLLDTEVLIKNLQEAPGHTHQEAVMILNHKTALEFGWQNKNYFKKLSPKKIEEIHYMIVHNLGIDKGIRNKPVGIIGTKYKPFDNRFQIREQLENLCKLLNKLKNPFQKALIAVAGISYLQPFMDGNKRTARLIGNTILLANNYCPLSYRSVDEVEYKKAIILFYEQHSLKSFKKLFLEQYEFAVKTYFP